MRLDYLEHALRDAGCVELRHELNGRWTSGTFSELSPLQDAVQSLRARGNLFTSLNTPSNVVALNRMGTRALNDRDFGWHCRIPLDFDPIREAGVPSTDVELKHAIRQRDQVITALVALGLPRPAVAVSGNGAHALYRSRLPVTPETKEMLAHLYRGLSQEFSTNNVTIDPTVRNPGRVLRLYGTMNRKGLACEERPHRRAHILIPDRWEGVSPKILERLAARYARSAPPAVSRAIEQSPHVRSSDFSTLDVARWFTSHDAYRRALGHGKHAVICPWSDRHTVADHPTSTSTVVWEGAAPSLWPNFKCLHAHCEGRGIRDVLDLWGDADAYCFKGWNQSGRAAA